MSDQDFFFDEEDEATTPASKPASRPAGKSAAPAPRKSAPRPAASGGFFEQNVSLVVASLMTVIGLLVGVIIGFVVAPDATTGTSATSTSTDMTAPQLTEDQLQSGTLPEGHPDISGMGETTPTESVTTTGN